MFIVIKPMITYSWDRECISFPRWGGGGGVHVLQNKLLYALILGKGGGARVSYWHGWLFDIEMEAWANLLGQR